MRSVLTAIGGALLVLAFIAAWVVGFPFGDGLVTDAHGRTLFQQWVSDRGAPPAFASCYVASEPGTGDIRVLAARDGDAISGTVRGSGVAGQQASGIFSAEVTGRTSYRGSFTIPGPPVRTVPVSGSWTANELEVVLEGQGGPVYLRRC